MNVQFVIIGKTKASYHISVDIDGKNAGILYLTENEKKELSAAMRLRAIQGNFEFCIIDETIPACE